MPKCIHSSKVKINILKKWWVLDHCKSTTSSCSFLFFSKSKQQTTYIQFIIFCLGQCTDILVFLCPVTYSLKRLHSSFFFFYWHLSFKSVASLWMLDTRGRYHNRSIYKRGIITPKWCLQYIPTYISIHDIICTFVYTKVSFSRD